MGNFLLKIYYTQRQILHPSHLHPPSLTASLSLSLQLESKQIRHHLPTRHPTGIPQRRHIERAGEAICQAKGNHGRDPAAGILERKAGRVHLVLFDGTAVEVVDGAGRVGFRFEGAWQVGGLRALDDVEVVVSGVTAGMTFGADGGA